MPGLCEKFKGSFKGILHDKKKLQICDFSREQSTHHTVYTSFYFMKKIVLGSVSRKVWIAFLAALWGPKLVKESICEHSMNAESVG